MEGACQREHSSDKTWETMGVVLGEEDASSWKWVQAAWFQAEEAACAKVQGLTGAPKGATYAKEMECSRFHPTGTEECLNMVPKSSDHLPQASPSPLPMLSSRTQAARPSGSWSFHSFQFAGQLESWPQAPLKGSDMRG